MADINLIPQEERASERAQNLQHRLQFFSIGLLVLTALFTVATLVLFSSFSAKRAELVAQVEDSTSRINSYKAQEELMVVVKDKAGSAGKIINSRIEFVKMFDKFQGLIPQNVYFTDVRVASAKIIISGKARTSADVAGLASSFTSAGGQEGLSEGSIDSLSAAEDGVYSFVLSAKVKGAELLAGGLGTAASSAGGNAPQGGGGELQQ